MKNANPTFLSSPSALRAWILAARPKTLIAGISPVLIGLAIASAYQSLSPLFALLCLLFSLSLQIGTNWANDYFDFCKGADTPNRKGPARAVQSGWITPKAMRFGGMIAFSASALIALPLLWRIGFVFLPLMLLCIACGILYTGGKRPLGYLGLGELLVLFFYGPVATCCTILAQLLFIPNEAWIASLAPGLFSCAILAINNLRDADEDHKANKLTLAARFGTSFARREYAACLFLAAMVPAALVIYGKSPFLLSIWLLIPLAIEPLRIVFHHPQNLNRALALTARLLALYTVLFYASFSL